MGFLFHLSISLLGMFSQFSYSMETVAQPCLNAASYKVHLTFDDGPKIPETIQILNTLKRNNIKATFFISTSHFDFVLKKNPSQYSAHEREILELLDRMKSEGHSIASHSFAHLDHTDISKASREQIRENLNKNFRVWKALKLPIPSPFRFPYGGGWFQSRNSAFQEMGDESMATILDEGFVPTHWDVDSWDWSAIKRRALPQSLLTQICNHHGGISLMHDIQPFTAQNLSTIIESIRKSGHQFVDLEGIRKYSNSYPLLSLRKKVSGIYYCGQSKGTLDQVSDHCPGENVHESEK